ncbi:MAG TPA: hypothetical protein P5198_07435 [Flexilinea sp.]|nr:hypothetical protein [Flexilinea sp.]HRY21325.1 hypothetical protein [Flexilinea sp.]
MLAESAILTEVPPEGLRNPATVDLMSLGLKVFLGIVFVILFFFIVKIIHDLRSYRYR